MKHYNIKHGLYGTSEYRSWSAMKDRCQNPNSCAYRHYGGRGITVCERWQTFENFIADIGKRPSDEYSLERIDVNGNYEPSNCKWATLEDQANNLRTSRRITFNGQTQTLTQWSRELGISDSTLRHRIDIGWTLEKAFFTPTKGGKNCFAQQCRKAGLNESTVSNRLKRGWTLEKALSTPKQKSGQFQYSDEQIEEMRKCHADGMSLSQIARQFGCSNSHAFRIVNHIRRKETNAC